VDLNEFMVENGVDQAAVQLLIQHNYHAIHFLCDLIITLTVLFHHDIYR
jgi:hypothetical protein